MLNRNIKIILREADIEGLIEAGAPDDEYDSEAILIAESLSSMTEDEINSDSVTAVIAAILIKQFNLSDKDLKARLPAIRIVTDEIVRLNGA